MSAALLAAMSGASGIINQSIPSGTNPISNTFELLNNGQYQIGDGAGGSTTGNWVTPATAIVAALYQAKTDVTAGAFTTDPSAGVYVDLSSNRQWSKLVAGVVTFTLTIREKATGLVRSTQAGMTLTTT